MRDTISVLSALLLTCATLSAVLLIAWRTLGRPRHALVWACAFGVATAQWAANLVYQLVWFVPAAMMGVHLLAIVVSVLLAVGFRARAGRPTRLGMWIAIVAAADVAVIVSTSLGAPALSAVIVNLLRTGALCTAAAALAPDRRPSRAAERLAATVLVLFAAVSLLTAALNGVALIVPGTASVLARALLMMTLPAALTAAGVSAVLLLASDLAERLHELAARDPLTDALNRRGFREAALRSLASAERAGRPVAVVLADLDRFKAINDTQGHAAGDAVLVTVSRYLEGAIRVGDLFGRLGGEEFALLLEGVTEVAAADVVERIRAGVEALDLGLPQPTTLTISFGIAGTSGGEGGPGLDMLLDAADQALYASKLAGRNRITCAGLAVGRPALAGAAVTAGAE